MLCNRAIILQRSVIVVIGIDVILIDRLRHLIVVAVIDRLNKRQRQQMHRVGGIVKSIDKISAVGIGSNRASLQCLVIVKLFHFRGVIVFDVGLIEGLHFG